MPKCFQERDSTKSYTSYQQSADTGRGVSHSKHSQPTLNQHEDGTLIGTLIRVTPELDPALLKQAQEGFAKVKDKNPEVSGEGGYAAWLAVEGDEVLGALTIAGTYGRIAEIGVNFFIPPSTKQLRILDHWGRHYLSFYDGLLCRVFPWNEPIKRVIQRFGFQKLGDDEELKAEVWGVLLKDVRWLESKRNK